jgi:alpha-L-fucosidase
MAGKAVALAERAKWFVDARFGMFIHWGLYSILGRGEWAMYLERIPGAEYAKLARRFSPTRCDIAQWAALAKQAGMKYCVMTSRHHDGFSLFDSRVSSFTSAKTRAGRDFIREYVTAVREAGLRVGLYYSLLDWRFPGYWAGPKKDPRGWARLVERVHAQVEELVTGYGRIDVLWFDGGWPWTAEDWKSRKLIGMIRRHQPHILINNRALWGGDFGTPEQQIIAQKNLWEACMTMNTWWGYYPADTNWKSTKQLVYYLLDCVSRGGNYLLNVGPKPDGTIPAPSVKRLTELGAWMAGNAASIHGCGQAGRLWPVMDFTSTVGPFTRKGSTVYLHALKWPGCQITVGAERDRIRAASFLATGEPITLEQHGRRVFLTGLPRKAPDALDTVIKLDLAR